MADIQDIKNAVVNVKKNEDIVKGIEMSLKALKAVADPAQVKEVEKLEAGIKEMVAMNAPIVEGYAGNLKAFHQGMIAKYGPTTGRVIVGVAVLAMAAKMFFLG